jgi:hypothetical protein
MHRLGKHRRAGPIGCAIGALASASCLAIDFDYAVGPQGGAAGATSSTASAAGGGSTTSSGGAAGTGGASGGGATGGGGAGGGCTSPSDCPGMDTSCQKRTCDANVCGTSNAPALTPCTEEGGVICDGMGACVPKAANGQSCTESGACTSGNCVDGVCCEAADCPGLCQSCAPVASPGKCGPVAPGTDPDMECPGDAVCDGLGACAGGAHVWSKKFGDAAGQYAGCVDIDATGKILLGGDFLGTVDFGGGPLTFAGAADVFLARFEATGSHAWSARYGAAGEQSALGCRFAPSGAMVLTGRFYTTIDFGGGAHLASAAGSTYLAKLDAAGTEIWSRAFGDGVTESAGRAVAVDPQGDVVFAGIARGGSIDYGGGLLVPGGDHDVVVGKYAGATGAYAWAKRFGDSDVQVAESVAVDPMGHVVVAGYFEGTLDFGLGALTSTNTKDPDAFVAKLDGTTGAGIWQLKLGGSKVDEAFGVAVDGKGDVLVAISFDDQITIGATQYTTNNNAVAIAKLDGKTGAPLWSKGYFDAVFTSRQAVAVEPTGHVLVTGTFENTTNLGGGNLVSAGGEDVFLVKLDPAGTHLWSRRFGSGPDQGPARVAAGTTGAALAARFGGQIDFGGGTLVSAGNGDVAVASFGP